MKTPLAALDIGAGKLACLIAAPPADDTQRPSPIIGVGRAAARHGAKGSHADFDGAARALGLAVDQAVRMAGVEEPEFGLCYAGPDIACVHASGAAKLPRKVVEARDVASALAAARGSVSLPTRRILMVSPFLYAVDGEQTLLDPRGVEGAELQAHVCIVHAPEEAVAAMQRLCAAVRCEPSVIQPAPYLAGLATLTVEERESGAVLLDIGETRTGLAIFRNGALMHAETLSGGGAHVTQEIARRLETSFSIAERAKLAFGGLTGEARPEQAVEVPLLGDDGRLEPGVALRGGIVEAAADRLGAIFAKAGRRLSDLGEGPGEAALGVALVGGVSLTPGVRALAAHVLKRPVRLAQPIDFGGLDDSIEGPTFAGAAGLLRSMSDDLVRRSQVPVYHPAVAGPLVRRGFGQAVAWIRQNF